MIVVGVLLMAGLLVGLLFCRPRRARRAGNSRRRKPRPRTSARAQPADHRPSERRRRPAHQEAAAEQAAALAAYERGTSALDAARRPEDMRVVSRAIAEAPVPAGGAEALANGQPNPDRRPTCFFDPRHGMSVADVAWTPPDGGPTREVPACADGQRKIERVFSQRCALCGDGRGAGRSMSTLVSPRRTGAVTGTARTCLPVSCSARRCPSSRATVTATASRAMAGGTATRGGTARRHFGGDDFGGGVISAAGGDFAAGTTSEAETSAGRLQRW